MKLIVLVCCREHTGSMYIIDKHNKIIKIVYESITNGSIDIGFKLSVDYKYKEVKSVHSILSVVIT